VHEAGHGTLRQLRQDLMGHSVHGREHEPSYAGACLPCCGMGVGGSRGVVTLCCLHSVGQGYICEMLNVP
jgi:hypothetical protein